MNLRLCSHCSNNLLVFDCMIGCVRLWDIRKAIDDPTNGQTIARSEHDIAHFSLGEPYTDEWPLVMYVPVVLPCLAH